MSDTLETLREAQDTYQPNEAVQEHLRHITIAPIIGPTAVGKSFCMEHIAQEDERFGRVQSFTTREQRPQEPASEYRFLPHAPERIAQILDAVGQGELVQYAVHPGTGRIYGSEVSDYDHPFMMLDAMAHSAEALRELPFKANTEITLVAEPHEWERRFFKRFSADESQKRIREGITSLEWSLEQGDAMRWACTYPGDANRERNAAQIKALILGEADTKGIEREIGERLLRLLRRLA